MKPVPGLLAGALVLSTAVFANAEPQNVASISPLYRHAPVSRAPAPPRAAPPPRPDPGPAPNSPEPVHVRHGFYLRIAGGGGYLSDSETGSNGSSGRVYGAGETFDVFIGGSIVPGFALGGGILAARSSNPMVTLGGQTVQSAGSVSLGVLSGFVDWYPSPTHGLHLLAMGGYARFGLADADGNSVGPAARGPAFGVGVGYEWSLGPRFGLGMMARYIYAPLEPTTSDGTATESISAPELVLTGTLY